MLIWRILWVGRGVTCNVYVGRLRFAFFKDAYLLVGEKQASPKTDLRTREVGEQRKDSHSKIDQRG